MTNWKHIKTNDYDLINTNLENFLATMINNKHYKKNKLISFMIFDFIEFYFNKVSFSFSANIFDKYSYFLKRINNTKNFNLDEESLFLEINSKLLNE